MSQSSRGIMGPFLRGVGKCEPLKDVPSWGVDGVFLRLQGACIFFDVLVCFCYIMLHRLSILVVFYKFHLPVSFCSCLGLAKVKHPSCTEVRMVWTFHFPKIFRRAQEGQLWKLLFLSGFLDAAGLSLKDHKEASAVKSEGKWQEHIQVYSAFSNKTNKTAKLRIVGVMNCSRKFGIKYCRWGDWSLLVL